MEISAVDKTWEKALRRRLLRMTLWTGAVFAALAAGFTVFFWQDSAAAGEIIAAYMPKVQSLTADDGSLSVIRLMMNNIFASAISIGLGIIPFLFLPAFSLLVNAAVIGAVLGMAAANSIVPVGRMIVFGLLPHGIFELPALFLSMAMGIYLCRLLSGKLLGRAKDEKLLPNFNALAKTFVLGALPLLAVAAVVECFVTPALMSWAGLA